MKKINVTETFTPPLREYYFQLEKIWQSKQFTNQGSCVVELEKAIVDFLGVNNIHYVSNGTMALQLALSSLGIDNGEIITTPFSYVASLSSILWQKCKPVFVDIEPHNFTLDPKKIESAISLKTKAILAVHVFGYACNVVAIEQLAKKYHLHVIYDGAHAFGAKYKGNSLLSYGDISTTSFHATKLFHTGEGGACIVQDKIVSDRLDLQKRFGHQGDEHFCLGINGKNSELHAALGLANFPYIEQNIIKRQQVSEWYDSELQTIVTRPAKQAELEYNYAYYPVLFSSEKELQNVFANLAKEQVFPRRYFYPSLNTLEYIDYSPCPIAEDIAKRIACLPLYPELSQEQVLRICRIIKNTL